MSFGKGKMEGPDGGESEVRVEASESIGSEKGGREVEEVVVVCGLVEG